MMVLMRNLLWQLYFLLSSWFGFAQGIESEVIAELPSDLDECSGMVFIDDFRMAMINDGGNEPELFIIDTNGNFINRIKLRGIKNTDWESLAIAEDELFIGDFGNNNNDRRDLKVYVVSTNDWSLKRSLKFYYPEQMGFPPDKDQLYYDLEAMLYRNDSLLLFTKNRSEPFDGLLKVYYLNPQLKEQAATLIQEIDMKGGLMQMKWITGAEKGLHSNDFFLLGYQYLWYFPELKGEGKADFLRYNLGYFSQKEGLAFRYPNLYFTEESHFTRPGKLHKARLDFLSEYQPQQAVSASLNNKHFKDSLQVNLKNPAAYEGVFWQVYAKDGSTVASDTIRNKYLNDKSLNLDLKKLSRGSHILSIEHPQAKQVFIIYKD